MDFLSIIITIFDRILPLGLKKLIPLIKIEPKILSFQKSKWNQKTFFSVSNISNDLLFDIYIMIDTKTCKTENFQIETNSLKDGFKENIGMILLNQEVVRFNLAYKDGEEFIILKIAKLNPRDTISFRITVNSEAEIKLKVLKYSKQPSKTLTQKDKIAISFEVPLKDKKRKFKLKSISFLMRKY